MQKVRVLGHIDWRHWTLGLSMRVNNYRWQTGFIVPFAIGVALGPFTAWFDFAERDPGVEVRP